MNKKVRLMIFTHPSVGLIPRGFIFGEVVIGLEVVPGALLNSPPSSLSLFIH